TEVKVEAEKETAPVSETPAQAEEMVSEKSETIADDEGPKMVLVWRQSGPKPNRQANNRTNNKSDDKSKNRQDRKPFKGKPRDKSHEKRNFSAKKPAPDKKIDPDSPFAKLAALKENLKSGD
ncbi:MAG: hypothetical protein WBC71_14500, partial [Salaquimonas sp.]